VVVEIGRRWCPHTSDHCARADEECAHDWTNRTGQSVNRDRARYTKPHSRTERNWPKLGSDDPMPPESNPCGEHRSEESTEDPSCPETTFAERVTDNRSERAAYTTERASNKE
jgi:hypothetical protein